MRSDPILLIAGPTASGKSALALALAQSEGGVVINADSMQIYRALPLLTAQPDAAALAAAPHQLYGCLDPARPCSAAQWCDLAREAITAAWAAGQLPIVTGGTGLYLESLRFGLSPIPEIPPTIRDESRALLAEIGNAAFHQRLAARDPVMAARLPPGDSQRMVRAWEVIEATGRSLESWQAEPRQGGLSARWLTLALQPPREALRAACDGRFLAMVAAGAAEEAAHFLDRNLDPALPVMKTLGLRELGAAQRGEMPLAEAIATAQAATRAYAKRQLTWLRHRFDANLLIDTQLSESLISPIFAKIRQFRLTPV